MAKALKTDKLRSARNKYKNKDLNQLKKAEWFEIAGAIQEYARGSDDPELIQYMIDGDKNKIVQWLRNNA